MHISTAYLTPPPPLSPPEKFWSVFIPISERGYESEKLVFGAGGEGPGGDGKGEFVVEVLVRGGGEGRRRAVERTLEGWSDTEGGAVDLVSLSSLQNIWLRKVVDQVGSLTVGSECCRVHSLSLRMLGATSRPNTEYAFQPQPHAITNTIQSPSSTTLRSRR